MTTPTAWPAGCDSATCFSFDLDAEEVWLAEAGADRRPGMVSMGTYGPTVALPMILELLARHEVTATFFVPGRVAERHPAALEAILGAGHEVGLHGYTHRSPVDLDRAEEERELELGLEALARVGARPEGYRAPNWEISVLTIALLEAAGFRYSSNLMDDIRPYLHADTEVVELPVHWLLDDAPFFWFSTDSFGRCIRSTAEAAAVIDEERAGLAAVRGLTLLTFHPQLIGRPGRLPLLERLIVDAVEDASVWVASAAEIAGFARRDQQLESKRTAI
ncbi:MAG: polysaccharide deacetylase family protein [Solirubrobacterales bacterium]